MRYSLEPKYRKYVKGYGFLSFAKKFEEKYGKKLMDTATKTRIDAAKTVTKRVVQKTAEATGDKTVGKTICKETETKTNEIYIPPEKRQFIDDVGLF